MKIRTTLAAALAVLSIALFAGCATTQPFIVDGKPVVCPFCGTTATTEHLYFGPGQRLDTTCAYCPRCHVGIDTPGMLDKAQVELIQKGLR